MKTTSPQIREDFMDSYGLAITGNSTWSVAVVVKDLEEFEAGFSDNMISESVIPMLGSLHKEDALELIYELQDEVDGGGSFPVYYDKSRPKLEVTKELLVDWELSEVYHLWKS